MQPTLERGRLRRLALCSAALLAGAVLAGPVSADATQPNAESRYRTDLLACQNNQTGQDRETCLKEARNALAAGRSGELATDTDALQHNRMQRCQVQTGEALAACLARMSGRGSISGDVPSGGILREVETIVIPAGAGPVVIEPKTADPVLLVPIRR